MRSGPEVEVVATAADAGRAVAGRIGDLLTTAAALDRRVVIGCPAGRTPQTTYAALGDLAAARDLDLTRLIVVMMDEYLDLIDGAFQGCDPYAAHSCQRFAEHALRGAVNGRIPPDRQLPAHQVHFPNPGAPVAYEQVIASLGGIDLFLLASGASDGHVAFNPAGSPLDSRTRIVELAESTRRDNLQTFPSFASLEEVPQWGVTVGLGTIVEHSRAVVLLLLGAEKRMAFERVTGAGDFDPAWPATVVWRCDGATVIADLDAAGITHPMPV